MLGLALGQGALLGSSEPTVQKGKSSSSLATKTLKPKRWVRPNARRSASELPLADPGLEKFPRTAAAARGEPSSQADAPAGADLGSGVSLPPLGLSAGPPVGVLLRSSSSSMEIRRETMARRASSVSTILSASSTPAPRPGAKCRELDTGGIPLGHQEILGEHDAVRSTALAEQGVRRDGGAYVVEGGIGVGGYSTVLLVSRRGSGEKFAMKVIRKRRYRSDTHRSRLIHELRISLELEPSPFLQRSTEVFEDAASVYLFSDFYSNGDLFVHLQHMAQRHHRGLSERRTRLIVSEVVLGLEHLHAHQFVHRDIKLENIAVDCDGHIKLIDFGLAHCMQDGHTTPPSGSVHYLAPEMLREGRVGTFTDWWALGVLVHELLTSYAPWTVINSCEQLRSEILSGRPRLSKSLSSTSTQFIKSLMNVDYMSRLGTLGTRQVKNHPFFQGLSWQAVAAREGERPIVGSVGTLQAAACPEAIHAYLHEEVRESANFYLGYPDIGSRPTATAEPGI
uniref:Protein kinase domain-containing protein n=1 Tax=Rhizochromulina marina TaxID=1034831 RepID=A0A7S2SPC4_9STRA